MKITNKQKGLGKWWLDSMFDPKLGFIDSPETTTYVRLETSDPGQDLYIRSVGGKYIAELDVPGFNKTDLTVLLEDDYLTISGKYPEYTYTSVEEGSRLPKHRASFSKRVYVSGANPEQIIATLTNGVLRIEIGKEEKAKSKQIEIKVV